MENSILLHNVVPEDVNKILNALSVLGSSKDIIFEIFTTRERRVNLESIMDGLSIQNSKLITQNKQTRSVVEKVFIVGSPNGLYSISIEATREDTWFVAVGVNSFDAGVKRLLTIDCQTKRPSEIKKRLYSFYEDVKILEVV